MLSELTTTIDREPFLLDFYVNKYSFTVVNFHSRPHHKNPEAEIAVLTTHFSEQKTPLLLVGDFNVSEQKPVFDSLKNNGFRAAIVNQKTTLKRACDGNNYLNYAIDNVFYSKDIQGMEAKVLDFVNFCEDLEKARKLSDHLPVFFRFRVG